MKFVRETKPLVIALFFMSLGGWLLHVRTHPLPVWQNGATIPGVSANWIPFLAGLLSILVIPVLLSFAKTVIIGYLANGMFVILGTILMTTYSLYHHPDQITLENLILKTMLADIVILFGKLFVGHKIMLHHHPAGMGRMFTPGWWTRHFLYLSLFFTLGHFIWR